MTAMPAAKPKKRHSYAVVLEPSPQGGYTIYVPALRGCVSEGETQKRRWKTSRTPSPSG